MERGKKIVLSIDIGGSKIRAISGRKFWEFDTPENKKEFVRILKKITGADKINVAVAGVVEGTKVKISPNIKYLKNFDFTKIYPRVRVDNDARSFLRKKLRKFGAKRILAFTIGTGIGRAWAEKGRVKKIKKLEYPEKWEREYQKIRDKKDYEKLAKFLGENLSVLIKKYEPEVVILGGGVLKKKGFYRKLKKELKIKTYE